ncbi:glycosyltransferase [Cohnella sp. 56]|uniref:glycosyltransferase n=1 Tax=Cohnella sp. 56 TaxID=3113722 RepID=UPI0030EA5FDD
MKLLFDLIATQPCGESKYHGGGEYAKIIFKFIVNKGYASQLSCFYDPELELDEEIRILLQTNQIELFSVKSHKEISDLLNSGYYHTFYSALPYHYHDLNIRKPGPKLIYTIHGLRQLEQPTDRYEIKFRQGVREKLKYVVKNMFKDRFVRHKKNQIEKILYTDADLEVVVPSSHTKFSLLNYFPRLNPDLLKVMYSPRNTDIDSIEYDLVQHGLTPGKYFLIISGNRWLKNGFRAVKALDKIYDDFDTDIKTVVLGVKDSKRFYKFIRNPDQFVFLDYISSGELDYFYRSAFCFIYPTLNEGFGYPPLESMRYGVPVIASSITSVPEVCGDGVMYFNPFSIEELKTRILSMMLDAPQREALINRARRVYDAVSRRQDQDLDQLTAILWQAQRTDNLYYANSSNY